MFQSATITTFAAKYLIVCLQTRCVLAIVAAVEVWATFIFDSQINIMQKGKLTKTYSGCKQDAFCANNDECAGKPCVNYECRCNG